MIEIVFGDSACGSLKVAQHCGRGSYGGSVGVVVSHTDGSKPTEQELRAAQWEAEEKARIAWENAVPMGGNAADVFSLGLAHSVGDIAEDGIGAGRRAALERLFGCCPGEMGREVAAEILHRAQSSLNSIRDRTAAGEPLRVWYSSQPDEKCGFFWLMAQLCAWNRPMGAVMTVELPDWEVKGETVVRHSGWGGVAPEAWSRYVTAQKEVPPALICGAAARWKELQAENAPLRAVINGTLQSVEEDFYDGFLLREIAAADDEFQEASLIGRVLGKYQLGIGDGWVALRIEELIRTGRLKPVSAAPDDSPSYHRMLKKMP